MRGESIDPCETGTAEDRPPVAHHPVTLVGDAGLPCPEEPLARRALILAFEEALLQHPGVVEGDSDTFPLTHRFAPGLYVREIFIPKGAALTGKIHKEAHPVFLMQGELVVVSEAGGRQHLKAPLVFIAAAGTKRAAIALEDTVWVTVHRTNETDLARIEAEVIAPDYAALATWQAARLEESP